MTSLTYPINRMRLQLNHHNISSQHILSTIITISQTYCFSSVSVTPKMKVPTTPDSYTEAIITRKRVEFSYNDDDTEYSIYSQEFLKIDTATLSNSLLSTAFLSLDTKISIKINTATRSNSLLGTAFLSLDTRISIRHEETQFSNTINALLTP